MDSFIFLLSVSFTASEASLHFNAASLLEEGKAGKDSTDKLECDYVGDDVTGEIF